MSWSDEELDKLFKDSADKLSFEFRPEFLDEFEALQDSADLGAVGTNDEIDMLYQQSASELSFEYKDAYWQEMQNFLPRRRQPDFLWWGTAILFIAALVTNIGVHGSSVETIESNLIADSQLKDIDQVTSNTYQKDQIETVDSDVSNTFESEENSQLSTDITKVIETSNERKSEISTGIGSENVTDEANDKIINNKPLPKEEPSETNQMDRTEASNSSIDNQVNSLAVVTLESAINRDMNELSHDPPQMDLRLPHAISYFVELNGGLSQSLTTPSDRISSNVGLGIGFQLNKGKYSLLTSVYGQISDHNDIVLNREAKVYGFGSQVYRYTMKYSQLYSLEANISLGYRMGRHQMFVGVRPSYVLGTKVGVTMMEEEVQTDRQTVYGHYVGINRFGIKPTLGYSYELPRNVTIGLNIGVQTMNAVDEQFIDGVNRTLPIDGQLFLRKTINFRKN